MANATTDFDHDSCLAHAAKKDALVMARVEDYIEAHGFSYPHTVAGRLHLPIGPVREAARKSSKLRMSYSTDSISFVTA